MSDTPSRLDGNVTAGALATVFSFEVTTARCTWAACRKTAVLAGLHVYVDAPGSWCAVHRVKRSCCGTRNPGWHLARSAWAAVPQIPTQAVGG